MFSAVMGKKTGRTSPIIRKTSYFFRKRKRQGRSVGGGEERLLPSSRDLLDYSQKRKRVCGSKSPNVASLGRNKRKRPFASQDSAFPSMRRKKRRNKRKANISTEKRGEKKLRPPNPKKIPVAFASMESPKAPSKKKGGTKKGGTSSLGKLKRGGKRSLLHSLEKGLEIG